MVFQRRLPSQLTALGKQLVPIWNIIGGREREGRDIDTTNKKNNDLEEDQIVFCKRLQLWTRLTIPSIAWVYGMEWWFQRMQFLIIMSTYSSRTKSIAHTVEPIFNNISNSDNCCYNDRSANPHFFLYLSHKIYFYNNEYKNRFPLLWRQLGQKVWD